MRCCLPSVTSFAAVLATVLAAPACGNVSEQTPDAPTPDAAIDASPDAPACTKTLLDGSMMVEPQGWSVVQIAPAALTYGPDYVRIATSTTAGATTSGMMLMNYPGAHEGPPFRLEVIALVEQVNPHNSYDAGAAILGSFTPPFGAGNDRDQMIYLDGGAVGWADDAQTAQVTIADNAYHTFVLAVDAGNVATLSVDGVQRLTRTGFTANGAIAIGDQTNDPNVDGVMRIRSIKLLCPE